MKVRETVERIKHSAQIYFEEKGYEATTLREIAKRVGINAASLYYYYPSKEDLYIDLLKDSQAHQNHAIEKLVKENDSGSVEEKLNLFFIGLIKIHIDNQSLSRFLLRNVFFPPTQLKDRLKNETISWMESCIPYLKKLFTEGIEKGVIRNIPIQQLIHSFIAIQSGYILYWMSLETDPSDDEIYHSWCFYWNGIQNCQDL
ncbi:TetR/AcrR family transcriptional regulator [Alkaliphilus crotonatoxidans]